MSDSSLGSSGSNGHQRMRGSDGEHQPNPPGMPAHQPISNPRDATVISNRPPIVPADTGVKLAPNELGKTLQGCTLAHFQLIEFVGGGGMGAVFKALDTMLQRTVAVKVLSRDQGRDDETVRRFQNEAQSAARLDHENIARVYFVGEEDGWYFIVFEYIEGTNVRDIVYRNGVLTVRSAFELTLQIAEALDHAAKRNVVHRDIKPSNILLMETGKAKLVDMGLARLHHVNPDEEGLTVSGVTLGTFDYISPEQARDPRVADARSDIYSLGCTLYFMLTGAPPFPDGNVLQKLLSHSGEAPPELTQVRSDVPVELSRIVNRMLAKKPSDRYQVPSQLIGELLSFGERNGWQPSTRGEPIYISPKVSRFGWAANHLPWIVPTACFFFFMAFYDPILLSNVAGASRLHWVIPAVEQREVATANKSRVNNNLPTPELDLDESDGGEIATESRASEAASDADQEGPTNELPKLGPLTFVVSEDPMKFPPDRGFYTLERAVNKAPPGTVIELQQIKPIVSESLYVGNNSLSIVAGLGYEPKIRFKPVSESAGESSSMLRVEGRLTLQGIHIELQTPIDPINDRWSVFELFGAAHVKLINCTITVIARDSFASRDLSIFRMGGRDRSITDDPFAANEDRPKIEMVNCAVRGETTLVRDHGYRGWDLEWANGFFVSSGKMIGLTPPANAAVTNDMIDIQLQNVTAIMDTGLLSANLEPQNSLQRRIFITANDSIFSTKAWSTFISFKGASGNGLSGKKLKFAGIGNAYEGVKTFFAIFNEDDMPTETKEWEEWRSTYAEKRSTVGQIGWAFKPDEDVSMAKKNVTDYQLDESSVDGTVGFDLETLPEFPQPLRLDDILGF